MLLAQCLVSGGCSVNKSFWRLLDFPWDSEIQVSRESVTNVSYTLNPGSLWGGGGRLFPPLPFGFLATWVAQKWIQWKLSSAVCYMWQFVSCPRTQLPLVSCPLSPVPLPPPPVIAQSRPPWSCMWMVSATSARRAGTSTSYSQASPWMERSGVCHICSVVQTQSPLTFKKVRVLKRGLWGYEGCTD